VRTHYPLDIETEMAIAVTEARPFEVDGIRVVVPDYMDEIVATLTHLARESSHVNQRSGVSVRLTVANREVLVANATRRALRHGEREVSPRISDLDALAASTMGKIEIETLDDGRDEQIADHLLRSAVLTVFKRRVPPGTLRDVVVSFEEGAIVHTGDDVSSADLARLVEDVPALREAVGQLAGGDESPAVLASAVELVLEGLHLSKRLNKDAVGDGRSTYRSRS
jgi:magnesium chelatase subunit I